ncbi:MAG: ATP-dependent Clp protease proteolytic subunit [Clostridiaceae bacterium]
MSELLFPSIVTNIDGHDQTTNLISYDLTKNRTVYIIGEIDDFMATSVLSQFRYLAAKSGDDITVVINSPGGSVTAGMAILDGMKTGFRCEMATFATGVAASMGALLLAAGTKGKRHASASTEIMIHQPLGGVQGQATDISLVAEHIQTVKRRLADRLADYCKKERDELLRDMERDYWLTAEEAKAYGLIDLVGYPEQF